jgi:glycosyltransferase involved in cell wall biosynthesis
MKAFTLMKVLWSFKNHENRKKLKFSIREYMDDVGESPLIAASPSNAYVGSELLGETHSKILLVVHDFSRSGVPYATLYLARALLSLHGKPPVVISPLDGPIREEFEREGFATIVDPLLFRYKKHAPEACDFVSKFERVIVTSLYSFSFIRYYRGIAKRLTWWIHETDTLFSDVEKLNVDLSLLCAACEAIWLGSPLCFSPAMRYASQNKLHLLLYGCTDTAVPHRVRQSKKFVFSIVGSIEQRKGQDVFLAAVEALPEELRINATFWIIGSPLPTQASKSFCKNLYSQAAHIPQVECIENLPLDKLQALYAEVNVFVSASRDDPMPMVITQGLMYSKVCLCSSAIGHSELLEDGKNGMIFTSESIKELSEKMAWSIQNSTELAKIGSAGREVYEQYFLMSSFIRNVDKLLEN